MTVEAAIELGPTGMSDGAPEQTSTGLSRPSWMDESGGERATTTDTSASERTAATSGPEADSGDDGKSDAGADAGKDKAGDVTADPGQEKQEGEADGKAEGEEESTDSKPPKGFVEIGALREAKAATKYFKSQTAELKAQIATLQQQLQTAPAVKAQDEAADKFAAFKVLNDDELDELADDDPVAAARYAKDLIAYERHQQNKAVSDAKAAEESERQAIQVQAAMDRIAEVLPDEAAENELIQIAKDHGLSEEFFYLTDPNIKITQTGPDGKEMTVPHAVGAAVVLEMLASIRDYASGNKITVDNVPDDVREQIIEDAKAEIVGKVRSGRDKPRKVSTLSPSNRTDGNRFAGKSYKDLSREEQEEYLRGGQ